MKSKILIAMAIVVLLGCSGCASSLTFERAKGAVFTDDKGEVKVIREPAPEYYALLPFAVSFDVLTYPFMFIGGLLSFAITGHLPY